MLVKAKEYYYHGGKEYFPGDKFEMDDRESQEVNLLCLIGKLELVAESSVPKAKVVAESKEPETPTYQTTSNEPEPTSVDEGNQTAEREEGATPQQRKRYYRRRDMRPRE